LVFFAEKQWSARRRVEVVMAKAAKNTAEPSQGGLPAGGSIDQIREILFGQTQREHEARATQIERLIDQRSAEAAERLEKTQAALERRVEKLATDMNARLDQLAAHVEQAEATAKRELGGTAKDLAGKIGDLDKRLTKDLHDQGQGLENKLQSLRQELNGAVSRLDEEKTGKLDLGDYLTEIGMRLKGDPTLGAIESSLSEMLKGNRDEKS
jgi:exonuclease VII large subunit